MFRRFISYYKPYQFLFWMDLVCAFVMSLIDLAFPLILRDLANGLFAGDTEAIWRALPWIAAILTGLYLVRFGCKYYVIYWGHVMGARMESNMRQELFDQYQRLSFSYYDQNNTGEMMSKLVSDLFDISELAHHGPEHLFISGVKIIGSFALLLTVNVPLTLVLAAITVAMGIFSYRRNIAMQAVYTDNRRKIAGVNAQLQDSLSGVRVVKSFANEHIEHDKFRRSNEAFYESKKSNYRQMAIYHGGNNLFEGILYIAVLVCGGALVAQGSLNPADLAMYALYLGIFMSPVQVLIEATELLQKGISGFRRFLEVIDEKPDIKDRAEAKPLSSVKGDISYENVSFHYADDETPVVEHINIDIPSGKTVALVGPSGGGKTTLCSLLPRFYDVTGGRVTLDGKDVRDLTLKSLRSAIGIVQQDVYLFGGSIKENILYGKPGATDEEVIEAAKRANIHDFVMELPDRYDTFVGERGARLSGGQKQRISIARVFLKNPPVLILDEATSALDNESERHIQESLTELAKDRTTIVIAHRLSTIRNADEILVLSGEGIEERGTHETLLAQNGLYAAYYNMQFDGIE